MVKVVSAQEMSRIEKLAYQEGASEEAFMNAAGREIAHHLLAFLGKMHLKPLIVLLCGRGNNGGDAYTAGAILVKGGFAVKAYALSSFDESSALSKLQNKRFQALGGEVLYPRSEEEISFANTHLIVDGIFGTGFHGVAEGLYKVAIQKANHSHLPIISIDIPSGVTSEGRFGGEAIVATETLCLGLPKTGCFIGEAWNHTGKIHLLDFGLKPSFIADAREDFNLIREEEITLPPMVRTRHKYQAGYVVGLAGSPDMPGASLLSSLASLRAGAGIVRLLHPKGMESQLANAPLELIRQGYDSTEEVSVLEPIQKAAAFFVGPGLGRSEATAAFLQKIMHRYSKPCVIDADALALLSSFPPKSILTPHHGEMNQLLKTSQKLELSQLHKETQKFSEKHQVIIVLKGAPTFIFSPGRVPYLSSRGDPGMATAGSGDVLTGIIAAFLAQMGDPLQAAILAVYIHGCAGERAAEEKSSYGMVAGDIIEALPHIFKNMVRYQSTKILKPSSKEVVGVNPSLV